MQSMLSKHVMDSLRAKEGHFAPARVCRKFKSLPGSVQIGTGFRNKLLREYSLSLQASGTVD